MSILSIISITYNNKEGLLRTLESVRRQDLVEIELVVIDGGSNDGTNMLIRDYEDIITTYISEKDDGIYDAMNRGISLSTGDYILFLNSGDHFYSEISLSQCIPHLKNEDIVCFDIEMVNKNQRFIKQHPDKLNMSYLMVDTFAHQSTCIKRCLFERVGNYDTSLSIAADWKFFIEAIAFYKASYKAVHSILSTNYLDGISSTGKGSLKRKYERIEVKESVFKLFDADYKKLELLSTNRFKILNELETSKVAQKLNSLWLRILLFFTKGKTLKDLK